jgi:uncharacterized protein YecT (DUF1311 family)
MRVILLGVLFAGYATAAAAQAPRLFDGVDSDRAITQACMSEEGRSCETVVQQACWAEAEARHEDLTGVFARACDERALAAWEIEMNAALAALRGKLAGRDLDDLERSQSAWRDSMRADAQMAVDSFQGGTGAGRAAAEVQARATAQRALFLAQMNESFP